MIQATIAPRTFSPNAVKGRACDLAHMLQVHVDLPRWLTNHEVMKTRSLCASAGLAQRQTEHGSQGWRIRTMNWRTSDLCLPCAAFYAFRQIVASRSAGLLPPDRQAFLIYRDERSAGRAMRPLPCQSGVRARPANSSALPAAFYALLDAKSIERDAEPVEISVLAHDVT